MLPSSDDDSSCTTQWSLSSSKKSRFWKWKYLPLIAGLLPVIGLSITFYLAKSNCRLERWTLPYVSYTGAKQPESMIFGLLFNIEASLCFWIILLSWKYSKLQDVAGTLNNVNLFIGITACSGLSIIANFQIVRGRYVHYVGASLLFIMGTVYSVTSSEIARRIYRRSLRGGASKHAAKLRFVFRRVISVVMTSALVTLTSLASYKKFHSDVYGYKIDDVEMDDVGSCTDLLRKKMENPHYNWYIDIISSVAEWIVVAGLLLSISLYYFEFKSVSYLQLSMYTTDDEDDFTSTNDEKLERYRHSSSRRNTSLSSCVTETTILQSSPKHQNGSREHQNDSRDEQYSIVRDNDDNTVENSQQQLTTKDCYSENSVESKT